MTRFRIAMMHEITADERAVWRKLAGRADPFESPLLHPEYVEALDAVRNDVRIGLVEKNEKLIGLLPFHLSEKNRGAPTGGEVSDLHAFLTTGASTDFRDWIRGFGLKRFDFDHLVGQVPDRYVFRRDPWFRINLTEGFSPYVGDLGQSSNILSQARRNRRRLEKSFGRVQLTWDSYDPEILDSLKLWKSDELDARGYSNPFRLPWVHGLITGLMKEASKHCHGLLSCMHAGEEVISIHFGIANRKTLVSWLPCINPVFARYSPGNLLLLELAREASNRDLKMIDLGRGENQTKLRLANDVSTMAIGSVCSSPLNFGLLKMKHLMRRCGSRLIRSKMFNRNAQRKFNVK
ncbi:MAG: GNAT family N-acetyltransferase [Planctomycetota bacterium]